MDNFSSKVELPRKYETVESIDADHRQMVRCKDKADARYHAILGVLKKFIHQDMSSREQPPDSKPPSLGHNKQEAVGAGAKPLSRKSESSHYLRETILKVNWSSNIPCSLLQESAFRRPC